MFRLAGSHVRQRMLCQATIDTCFRAVAATQARRLYCSGRIFDVFQFEDISKRPPVYTIAGLKKRFSVYKGHLKSILSITVIRKHCPGFTPKTFPPVADNIFQSFIDAHRKGDLSGLSYLATEGLYASLKADVTFAGRRRKGSGPMTRAAFRLVRMTEPTCILQFRHAVEDGSNNKSGWGQITCQFVSEREIVAVDHRGREIPPPQGSNRVVENVTIGVLEAFFKDAKPRWRIAMLNEVGNAGPSASVADSQSAKQ